MGDAGDATQAAIDFIFVDTIAGVTYCHGYDFLGLARKQSGGFFTPIILPGVILWVDEAAIPRQLPENRVVRAVFNLGMPIFGPVVITGGADEDANVTGVPPYIRGRIEAYFDATL